MPVTLATGLVVGVCGYFAIGLVFSVAFVSRGVQRIDPVAREGTWGFRLMILPGAAAFWPILLRRWILGVSSPPEERNAHLDGARRWRRMPGLEDAGG